MHWLWSYAMCLPEQWRETRMHANNSGAQCPAATLEAIHPLFLALGLFMAYNNVCLPTFIFGYSSFFCLFWTQCNELGKRQHEPLFTRTATTCQLTMPWYFLFQLECKAAKLRVQWTLRVSNRRDQQVFHLAAVQIEWVTRLRLLWRV